LITRKSGSFCGVHLRLEVVGRHVGAFNDLPAFSLEFDLPAPVEEVGNVCILFGLGEPELFQASIRNDLSDGVFGLLGWIGNRQTERFVVLCECDKSDVW
jgi:hypothetical protein